MEKSKGLSAYMAIRSIVIESVIFNARRKSRTIGGKGIIITTRTVTTPIMVIISLVGETLSELSTEFSSIINTSIPLFASEYFSLNGAELNRSLP